MDIDIGGGADVLELGQTVGRLDVDQSPVDSVLVVVVVDILVLVVRLTVIVNVNRLGGAQVKLAIDDFADKVDDLVGLVILLQRLGERGGLDLADGGGWSSEVDVEGRQVLRYSCEEGND